MYKEVQELANLANCHWGPKPASQIVTPLEPSSQGVLNLLYLIQDGGQDVSIGIDWFRCKYLGDQIVHNYPVHEWATLFKPDKFYRDIILEARFHFASIMPLYTWKERCGK